MSEENIVGRQLHELAADQGAAMQETIEVSDRSLVDLLPRLPEDGLERIYVVGCGTSYFAAESCKYVFEELAGIPTEGMQAHAFATYQEPSLLDERTMVVAFTCGGASAAAVDSLSKVKSRGGYALAVTAIPDSPAAEVADGVVLIGAAEDIGAPHTKSHTRGLFSLYLTAIRLAERYGAEPSDTEHRMMQLHAAAPAIAQVVRDEETWRQLAAEYGACAKVFIFGMGPNTGTAAYGALMTTEMAKIYANGHELEDFLHGRLREIDQVNPMMFIGPEGKGTSRLLDFLTVVQRIPAQTIVLTDRPHPGMADLATKVISMPGGLDEIFTPLVYSVPFQVFGYHLALTRGWDPSRRRYFNDISPTIIRYTGPN
jgi:glucosamine--fructose-6-phosphate aminotransferase (isomerizing)